MARDDPDAYTKLRLAANSNRESERKRLQETAKRRLFNCTRKRLMTAFVGALDKFEQEFGVELWNHGAPIEECDDDDIYWRDKWSKCRDLVLDNGNDQIELMAEEFDKLKTVDYENDHTYYQRKRVSQ